MRTMEMAVSFSCLIALSAALSGRAADAKPAPDPFADRYTGYNPGFSFPRDMAAKDGSSEDPRKLSSEPRFFTLNLLPESDRANALVRAGIEKEQENEFREAADIYQRVIDDYADKLYRVSEFGIFVPVAHYVQLRILGFPDASRRHYRVKHDAAAAEAFSLALQRNSLEGLAEVRDRMLATSYGVRAMLTLGDMALDRGHYLEALEYYATVRDRFPDPEARTPELALKIAYCRKMLGDSDQDESPRARGDSRLPAEHLKAFRAFVDRAKRPKTDTFAQAASAPHLAADDWRIWPASRDPLGIAEPVWRLRLPGAREGGGFHGGDGFRDVAVYTQPVVAGDSVIFRHKNVVYCHSLLNGSLRWKNDLGGRVEWQDRGERQLPMEDVLVQDGLVFTPVFNVGPSLAALDLVTGRLRWAYGPMVAATSEEANLRFEAAPAAGGGSVFAGYVLDNIEGETHTDTEYGLMAFESATGRLRWRQELGRLRPGLFQAGFAEQRRNRIRSFTSPPLYHEGTVYYTTNAGAITALDALSGRIKWIMRHPYLAGIHDATRRYEGPVLWFNHRPLLVGDALYVTPVNSRDMFRLDRRSGRVVWSRPKGVGKIQIPHGHPHGNQAWFLGPTADGALAIAYSQRNRGAGHLGSLDYGVHLLDPDDGTVLWESGDLLTRAEEPTLKHFYSGSGSPGGRHLAFGANGWQYTISARPFLSDDGRLHWASYFYHGWPIFEWSTHLTILCLRSREAMARRRYLGGRILAMCADAIDIVNAPIREYEDLPHLGDRQKDQLRDFKEIRDSQPPVNEQGPFLPFSRVTFERFGHPFEFRMGPREIAMLYPLGGVRQTLANRTDVSDLFARAELAIADNRLPEAATLLAQCLADLPPEDLDFRAMVNQQLYQTRKRLARRAVRAADADTELKQVVGMSRSVGTLDDEIETMFALSEAYRRRNDFANAARQARNIISTYGHYEYATPSILSGDRAALAAAAENVFGQGGAFAGQTLFGRETMRSLHLMKRGVPLYFSALSPLDKDLSVRAGDLAADLLAGWQKESDAFAAAFEKEARLALDGKPSEEQLVRLQEFPGTAAAQHSLDGLLAAAAAELDRPDTASARQARLRRRLWRLTDEARLARLRLPDTLRARLTAPTQSSVPHPVARALKNRSASFDEERGPAWLALERRGRQDIEPDLVFLGGRVRTRFDHKFLLYALDMNTGAVRWKAAEQRGETWFDELRLDGLGDEPGFFEAFVRADSVIVRGRYDVLAFRLTDGTLKWRWRVPFAFETRHALESGNLLILAGQSETVALFMDTDDPRGEVAWQEREEGDLYAAPWFHGDRLVCLRRLPFNLTVRFRGTGRLIGRLALPELMLQDEHPLWEEGPRALPFASHGRRALVSDGDYWIMLDIERMKTEWKRLIDNNDPSKMPPMRFAMADDHVAIVKQDFDVKTLYMLSAETGDILWRTDPKDRQTPQPLHSMFLLDGKLYGLRLHPGQGFYLAALNAADGKPLFPQTEQKDYVGKPDTRLLPALYGDTLAVLVRDRQDFEVKAFSAADGKMSHTLKHKAAGDFGEHGRASATVWNGGLFLLGGHELVWASP